VGQNQASPRRDTKRSKRNAGARGEAIKRTWGGRGVYARSASGWTVCRGHEATCERTLLADPARVHIRDPKGRSGREGRANAKAKSTPDGALAATFSRSGAADYENPTEVPPCRKVDVVNDQGKLYGRPGGPMRACAWWSTEAGASRCAIPTGHRRARHPPVREGEMTMSKQFPIRAREEGVMLIEALIAILIFSIGISPSSAWKATR